MTSPSDPPDETSPERAEYLEGKTVDCRNFADVRALASGKTLIMGQLPQEMTQAQAFVLASWLICLGQQLQAEEPLEFGDVLNSVEAELYKKGQADGS